MYYQRGCPNVAPHYVLCTQCTLSKKSADSCLVYRYVNYDFEMLKSLLGQLSKKGKLCYLSEKVEIYFLLKSLIWFNSDFWCIAKSISWKIRKTTCTYYFCNLLTLESGIDVGQEISVGPGKFDKNNPKILPKLKINNKKKITF